VEATTSPTAQIAVVQSEASCSKATHVASAQFDEWEELLKKSRTYRQVHGRYTGRQGAQRLFAASSASQKGGP